MNDTYYTVLNLYRKLLDHIYTLTTMGLHNATLSHVQRLEHPAGFLPFYTIFLLILAGIIILLPRSYAKEPPKLKEQIPYVSNTWQYVTNMTVFMERAL